MSNERRKPYPFDVLEPKWQQLWDERQTFHVLNPGEPGFDASKPKYYVLDMFPYPSGAGLHVGHPEGYTATDIIGRFKKMNGYNVLHPMGWDAFGLPAEQYAIKTGQHPAVTTAANVANFTAQLKRIGFAYDWQREVNTTDPGYYKWTQWIFLKLYNSYFDYELEKAQPISLLEDALTLDKGNFDYEKNAYLAGIHLAFTKLPENQRELFRKSVIESRRLAYVAEVPVNWCSELGTVLANEEVVDGKSEVGGFPVERRPMRQWMLRITKYAQRLIDELDGLDWPESIKIHQRNWIGRSEGGEVTFGVAGSEQTITVFTTRPDTLFGATYMVLAPEHPLIEKITAAEWPANTPAEWKGADQSAIANPQSAIAAYRTSISSKSDLERTELSKDKTGVWTGAFAINPVNEEKIPIWIADYVMMNYGTGAIMAVPAHDERDWEFAKKFALPIRAVVSQEPVLGLGGESPCSAEPLECFGGEGYAINSSVLNGLPTAEAKNEILKRLEEKGVGKKTINYKLRDWLFSRQRYWGEPFPIVWENGQHRAIPESELPLTPPKLDDFKPTGTPEPPLSKAKDWVRYSETATRELNTMPQWAGSCWYYLRYIDSQNSSRFVGEEAERYWMTGSLESNQPSKIQNQKFPGGVDLYVGGTEHAVLHLLYARFWHKVLFDLGFVSTPEPFQRLVNQGLILGEDGQKMSKSRGNVVNPDHVIAEYGADSLRLYEMFMGPLEATKPWSMSGVEGVSRFLARVWRLVMEEDQTGEWIPSSNLQDIEIEKPLAKVIHATIKKVGEDIEALSFNTAISQMMVCTNALTGATARPRSGIKLLLQTLNPFAPHLTEELWQRLGGEGLCCEQPWPKYDPAMLIEDEVEIPVQVNGKVRDKIVVKKDASQADIESAAMACPKVQEHMAGKAVKKTIIVPGRLVNIVVA